MKLGKVLCKNQSGSTLILVVVAVAFVGIMATLLLSLTTMNYQMKNIDQTAKANFYSAEIAMDEIKLSLQDLTAEQMKEAYSELLVHYTDEDKNDETKKQKFLTKTFIGNMLESMGNHDPNATEFKYSQDILKKYLSKGNIITDPSDAIVEKKTDSVTGDEYLMLRNVAVEYVEDNGYSTNIKTDIRISGPSMTSTGVQPTVYPNFGDFVFIAEGKVEILSGIPAFGAEGSIYAGGLSQDSNLNTTDPEGLVVKSDSSVTVKGNHKVITKTDIVVENNGNLVIGEAGSANVWANNIRTRSTDSTSAAKLTIYGKTYTKDDLALDATNSQVTLSGGYHGFSYGTTPYDQEGKPAPATAGNSSAIMINGMSSKLDLSGITDFLVAGRAFISAKYGQQGDHDVTIGESLTVKHNQIAYLVPSKYMTVGRNPMTAKEILDLKNDNKPLIKRPELIKDLGTYLKYKDDNGEDVDPFVTISPQTAYDDMQLTYFYLNFKNQTMANEFFEKYYLDNGKQIDEYMKMYVADKDGIILPKMDKINGQFTIGGNLLSFINDKSSLTGPTINVEELEEHLIKQEDSTNQRYTDLTQSLLEYSPFILNEEEKKSIFAFLIKEAKMPINNGSQVVEVNHGEETYKAIFANGDYSIDTSMKGLVVATGDVRVKSNFTGTIISKGKIFVDSTVNNVKVDKEMMKVILADGNVKENLKAYQSAVSSGGILQIDFSKQLTYENWRKY